MPADLMLPFDPSCCEGGVCGPAESAQPCGCDPGASWVCERHRKLYKILQDGRDAMAREEARIDESIFANEDLMRDTIPAMGWAERRTSTVPEVRVVDPHTGGEKGQKLARFDLIPPEALWALAEVYGRGASKYEDRNWEKGYRWGLSVGALERHLNLWKQHESLDAETGAHHLMQVAWHAIALYTFEIRELGTDDVRIRK